MPLDLKAKKMLETMKKMGIPAMSTQSIEELRRAMPQMARTSTKSPTPVASISNSSILGPAGDLPVRIYRPEGTGPFPMLIYFHGGGFVMGNLESHDPTCRDVCDRAHCLVISCRCMKTF
ncbi:MAG: alpha/beta hydrolase [Thermodesulfobacteriota bacterium]